jgi:hypothetical protein
LIDSESNDIRKGVMIDGMWKKVRDKESSQKESHKKDIG